MQKPLLEERALRANGKKGGSGTPLSTALNLAASSMGTGLLTLPHAFARCGPALCMLLLAILAVTTDVTLILLIRLGRHLGVSTFGSLMQRLFGKNGSACFQLMLISVLFLALTAMQRVVLDLLPIFMEAMCGLRHVSPLGLSMIVNVFVLAACFSGSYHALRFTSGAALLCLVPFVVALGQDALADRSEQPLPRPASEAADFQGFLLASPILASALAGGHFSVMEMAAELKPQHKDSIYTVIHVVFLGVLPVCYVLVSLAGVSLFGADTPEDILVEFQGNSVMELARGVLSFTNALRMPLILMPLHSLVCDTLVLFASKDAKDKNAANGHPLIAAWRTVVGMPVLLFGAACLAQWLSTLSSILGLLGGTCGVLGCFCIPGTMYLWVWHRERNISSNYAVLAALAIVVGFAVVVSCGLSWVW